MNAFVPSGIIKRRHHAASVGTPLARILPRITAAHSRERGEAVFLFAAPRNGKRFRIGKMNDGSVRH